MNNCRDFNPNAGPTHDCCVSGKGRKEYSFKLRSELSFQQLTGIGLTGIHGDGARRQEQGDAKLRKEEPTVLVMIKRLYLVINIREHLVITCWDILTNK